MDTVDITIIGAGVIGLAIAAELAGDGGDIVVLEHHDAFGRETSSRNSEVIHSGIYYPPGSLKASLCVEGAALLYQRCRDAGIPHARLGKYIVATEEGERGCLESLFSTALNNGVDDVVMRDGRDVRSDEPAVRCVTAIFSPSTGIVDSHSLMADLYHRASAGGVLFSFNSTLSSIEKTGDGYILGIDEENYRFHSSVVINAAGLQSDRVAALAGMDVDNAGYRLRYCKGSYFSYEKPSPVRRLVYPVPHTDLMGLGVHATLDLKGRLRFGPDAEYVDEIDYRVDAGRRDAFFDGASRIISGLDREAFIPDMAGVRPKIAGEGTKDFVIRHEADRGLEGFINLVGMESPGLTACLSVARLVSRLVKEVV